MEQKLNKEKYIKRVIIVCWVALALCFIIKLFGGNFFQIICENQTFIAICDYADKSWIISYLIGATNTLICLYFFTLAICGKTKFEIWELLVVIATVFIGTAVKRLNVIIGLCFDVWQFIAMPLVFIRKDIKTKWWVILLANALLFVFQAISMFIKNLGFGILSNTNGVLINLIFTIDVFLMIILYYLYSILIKYKKEKIN